MVPLFACFTDFHLDKDNLPLIERLAHESFDVMDARGVKRLYLPGDAFKSRTGQPLAVLDTMGRILEEAHRRGYDTRAIPGNHDKTDLESNRSYLDQFKYYPGFTLYDDGAVHQIEQDGAAYQICWLPYFKENGSYPAKLAALSNMLDPFAARTFLLTHIGINSVFDNDGLQVENALDAARFACWDTVIVGHYHQKNSFENIHFIGSMRPANFGENADKGLTFAYADGRMEQVPLSFPKFLNLKIDIKDTASLKEAELLYANSPDHIRLTITGDQALLKSVNRERYAELGIDVKFNETHLVANMLKAQEGQTVSFNKQSLEEAFRQFASESRLSDVETGLELLQSAF
jgi:DNA repair exonuclease SbcCD nuclease subunit